MSTEKSNSTSQDMLRIAATGAGLLVAGYALYRELTKYNLRDKVVLITGGSRGLGLLLARQLAAKGAKLALCARSFEKLKQAESELRHHGAEVLTVQCDITNRAAVDRTIDQVIDHFGKLDVLINNAGIVQVGPAEAMEIADYEKSMQTNFWGPLYAIRASLPHFLANGEGRIMNVSSIGGKIAMPHILPYTASKFALTGLSEGLHAELKKHNIHVTTVVPNLMRTGSPRNIDVKGDHEAEYAWFKISDSFPLLSQDAEDSARKIIQALEYGDTEVILTLTAKAAILAKGLAPAWVTTLMTIVDHFLPANTPEGFKTKKGFESESHRSRGPVTSLTDRAAIRNNEM
jgi:NAD(P)-dependent dehydrogenase (short-subunit alcohol dehydrogenase family)